MTTAKSQDNNMSPFAKRLKQLLLERNKPASWLEEKAGLGTGTLSKLFTSENREPSTATRKKIAAALDVPVSTFDLGSDEEATALLVAAEAKAAERRRAPRADVEYNDRYNSRALVVRSLRGVYDDEVLDAVCMEAEHGDDPGEAYWRKRVKEIWREREAAKLEVSKPFAPLDFSMISEPERR